MKPIQLGRALRYTEPYTSEAASAASEGFEFLQVWFFRGSLSLSGLVEPREAGVRACGFPILLHAAFDLADFEKHGEKLVELVDFFGHREVIIHPLCTSVPPTPDAARVLSDKLSAIHPPLQRRGVKLYVENNSVIDGFFNTVPELRTVFDAHPEIGLLLDLAHINDYDHLRELLGMRRPECIHIADKRFGVPHEHLALGDGDLDFDWIFGQLLPGYSGRVILEAVESPEEILRSKARLDALVG